MTQEQLQSKISEIQLDIQNATALEVVAKSEGGKAIIGALLKDLGSAIELLTMETDNLTLANFIAIASKIRERLTIYKVLTGSQSNKNYLVEVLKEAFKEAGLDENGKVASSA